MRSRRILIIAPTAYPLGGVTVWLNYLLHGLDGDDFELVFGAVDGDFHNARKYLERFPFDRNIIIENPSKTAYGRVCAISAAITEIDPSIVVSVNIPDVYRAARDLKRATHPDLVVVASLHGLMPRLFQDMCRYADCIDHIVVTNLLTQLMVQESTPFTIDNISYAPYGVKEQNDVPNREIGSRVRLLYCGRIENDQKRCADIVKIVDQLEQQSIAYELRIAGDGPYKAQFLDGLNAVAKNDKIIDLGLLNERELIDVGYAQSDILLLTSDWETGPIVVWEAMAAGLGVVTSRYKGLAAEGALLDSINCLIFDIGDINGAVDKITQCFDQTVYQEIVSGGLSLSKKRYSRPSSLAAWHAVFDDLCVNPQDIPKHRETSKTELVYNEYPRNGLIERLFGVRNGSYLRALIAKPAYTDSAGDEWPHTHSNNDESFSERFYQQLSNVEN